MQGATAEVVEAYTESVGGQCEEAGGVTEGSDAGAVQRSVGHPAQDRRRPHDREPPSRTCSSFRLRTRSGSTPASACGGSRLDSSNPPHARPVRSRRRSPRPLRSPERLRCDWLAPAYAAHFHAVARLGRFDLYHEPNLVPFRVPLPTVVTVHDLSVILFPQWHPAERVKRYEQAFARGVAAAAHILVDSDAVRSEALRVLGLAPERVTTVHCGIGADLPPAVAGGNRRRPHTARPPAAVSPLRRHG